MVAGSEIEIVACLEQHMSPSARLEQKRLTGVQHRDPRLKAVATDWYYQGKWMRMSAGSKPWVGEQLTYSIPAAGLIVICLQDASL